MEASLDRVTPIDSAGILVIAAQGEVLTSLLVVAVVYGARVSVVASAFRKVREDGRGRRRKDVYPIGV